MPDSACKQIYTHLTVLDILKISRIYAIINRSGGLAMLEIQKLKKRDIYIKKLIRFQDTEPVKVITGIRRCGKSSLLKLMIQHL